MSIERVPILKHCDIFDAPDKGDLGVLTLARNARVQSLVLEPLKLSKSSKKQSYKGRPGEMELVKDLIVELLNIIHGHDCTPRREYWPEYVQLVCHNPQEEAMGNMDTILTKLCLKAQLQLRDSQITGKKRRQSLLAITDVFHERKKHFSKRNEVSLKTSVAKKMLPLMERYFPDKNQLSERENKIKQNFKRETEAVSFQERITFLYSVYCEKYSPDSRELNADWALTQSILENSDKPLDKLVYALTSECQLRYQTVSSYVADGFTTDESKIYSDDVVSADSESEWAFDCALSVFSSLDALYIDTEPPLALWCATLRSTDNDISIPISKGVFCDYDCNGSIDNTL